MILTHSVRSESRNLLRNLIGDSLSPGELVFTHKSTRWTPGVLPLPQRDSNSKSPNPKSETNSKARKSKIQDVYRDSWESDGFIGVFFVSNLGFVSDFEFRISDFSARAAVSSQKVMGHLQPKGARVRGNCFASAGSIKIKIK